MGLSGYPVGYADPSLGSGLPVHADGRGQETLPSSFPALLELETQDPSLGIMGLGLRSA